jgi:hypothetical protein
MKKIILISFSALVCVSCIEKEKTIPGTIIIIGKVVDPNQNPVYDCKIELYLRSLYNMLGGYIPPVQTKYTDEQGLFIVEFSPGKTNNGSYWQYHLEFSRDDYPIESFSIDLYKGAIQTCNITMGELPYVQ